MSPSGNAMMLCFPTEAGKTTSDGINGRNGIYTQAVLKFIERPNLSISDIFQRVHDEVTANTNNEQKPCVYASMGSVYNFCLKYQDENTLYTSNAESANYIKKYRESLPDPKTDINHLFILARRQLTSVVVNQLDAIKDTLNKDLEGYSYGNPPDTNNTYGLCYGLRLSSSQTKIIAPVSQIKLEGSSIIFTIKNGFIPYPEYPVEILTKYENDHHLSHEVSRRYSIYEINWAEIKEIIKNYFYLRCEILK